MRNRNPNRRRSNDFSYVTGFALGGLAWRALLALGVIGWIMNIVDLVRMSDTLGPVAEWTLVIWLKMVGVFMVPLGSIMGWFF